MNVVILAIVQVLIVVDARLIGNKLKEKNVYSVEPKKVILTSNEDRQDSSSEYFKFYNKKIETRSSNERIVKSVNVTKSKQTARPLAVLVKKPIPKFNDNGSDEDYQAKMKTPTKFSDSVEHEDEDFNVDDYDFDVNHDEFAGRGKPLEPRVKLNKHRVKPESPKKEEQPRPKPVLVESKVVLPHNNEKGPNKVVRKAADKMKEEEYDDEFSATTKRMETYIKKVTTGTEVSDENEESKEEESRSIRTIRSAMSFAPHMDRLGDQKS